jgi:flagellar hook-length control protein FliK
MNNGHLLDSLLAPSSVNPAHKKSPRPASASSVAEGFQNTLAQVRTKVAVNKPVPAAARLAAQEASRNTGAEKQAVKRHTASQSAAANVRAQQDRSKAAIHDQQKAITAAKSVDGRQPEEPLTREDLDGGIRHSNQPREITTVAKALQEEAAVGHDAQESLLPETILSESLLADLQPDLTVANDAILPPALANQIAIALGALGAGSGASTLAPSAALSTAVPGTLNPNALAEALAQEGEAESGLAQGEVSDNPDLLLLNAKSMLERLAQASAQASDKAGLADDSIKALTTAAPAVENLTRLTEAQSPAARAFVVQTGVPVALGQPQWGQAVGERVLWLAAQNISAAEIRLDPPELGPMQVRVSVNQDQVNVSFVSPHPVVRDVLDQQLNRLREMFAEQGLNLGDVDVSDKSFAQQDQEKQESSKNAAVSSLDDEDNPTLSSAIIQSSRLVDHYA